MTYLAFLVELLFVAVGVFFILALRGLSSASTSHRGNMYGAAGMLIVISFPLLSCIFWSGSQAPGFHYLLTLLAISAGGGIGYRIAKCTAMTDLPQLIAAFHSLVGLAAVCIAVSVYLAPNLHKISVGNDGLIPFANAIEMSVGATIGALTFTGSVVAFGKLHGLIRRALIFRGQHKINLLLGIVILLLIGLFSSYQSACVFTILLILACLIGYLLIMPIGGADMPVIVSMLNSYSGWTAAGIGFTLNNTLLIIVGALVGTSGAILSSIMCRGMNRSLFNVIIGGVGTSSGAQQSDTSQRRDVKVCSAEDAAYIIQNAGSVIIVPGYGMAVSQAQHIIREMADALKKRDITVKYAIHPVAGRMPGHMNVLLAEANIPYEEVYELDDINHEFSNTDVALVIGANDITNPAAKTDKTSPIYGMPVLDVEKAKTVLFIKRSLGAGYAGIDNPLFCYGNTMLVLGDAKKVSESILKEMQSDH
ncbi:MAG: NAD(P)(+) transhydrogenase (Re/Si-specific) subunit beta [Holosporales bacterium]|jgi:NAD(P) transhydrogenase subunit beta|nr:NAD(P)(+) transhydrogenase (Re/Si-specific) subunit beta [Holosporales bacterium]